MKAWDVIVIGAGIIGLSLAISLRKQGLRVLIVERGEPGREASYAAAGMLAGSGIEIPTPLRPLAEASARMYPEFVHELEDDSGIKVDLREHGTILVSDNGKFPEGARPVSLDELSTVEPELLRGQVRPLPRESDRPRIAFLSESSVDPRALVSAALKAAKHRDVDISSGTEATKVLVEGDRVAGIQTDKTSYSTSIVVNCAGAWAGCFGPVRFPVKPVKGQMLALIEGPTIKHVVRSDNVYLVPRSDGRLVIGSTLEHAGYDKRTDVDTIQKLFQAAADLVPVLAKSKKHEDWAGLRPGTPDELPILGETSTRGYFVATGHYRDGILLAPITAKLMAAMVSGDPSSFDLKSFSPARFQTSKAVHHRDTESQRKS